MHLQLKCMEMYNPWWVGEEDEDYSKWKNSTIKWMPSVVNKIVLSPFALNFIYGPRQVGKTTAVKILIHELLKKHDARSIFYYSCDELSDYNELGEILDNYEAMRKVWKIKKSFIFLDEITFVKEWWRTIKARIDRGIFKGDVIVITGSASIELMKQKEFFPGRRGKGENYLMLPLSFSEYAELIEGLRVSAGEIEKIDKNFLKNSIYKEKLKTAFEKYLETGGFPLSIIDFHLYGRVSLSTLKTYLDWLRGDWLKAGKSEKYMKEVISYIIRARGTPISWNGIASETGINSPNTVRSYIEVLEATFSAKILYFLSQKIDYKKNKKIHFTDPLFYHVFSNYCREQIDKHWMIEGVAAFLISRKCPAYYWRNSTEVDVICNEKEKIGFEITLGIKKWKRPKGMKKAYLLDRDNIHLYLASI